MKDMKELCEVLESCRHPYPTAKCAAREIGYIEQRALVDS